MSTRWGAYQRDVLFGSGFFCKTFANGIVQADRKNQDRDRADPGEQGSGPRKDGIQTGTGDNGAGNSKGDQPGTVGKFAERFLEVFRAAGEKTGAYIQAGDQEDQTGKNASKASPGLSSRGRKNLRTVCEGTKERAVARRADGQKNVHESKKNTGAKCGKRERLIFLLDVHFFDVGRNQNAKAEGGQNIHGLIAFVQAGPEGGARKRGSWSGNTGWRKQKRNADAEDQNQKNRAHDLAQNILKLSGMDGHEVGGNKKETDRRNLNGSGWNQPGPHFHRGSGGTRNGDAWTDQ